MDMWEGMILNLPRLQHLELIASCYKDVIDGQRWEKNVKDLVTFKFMFYTYVARPQELDSFRTSFWLQHKRWFVAYMKGQFFSLPHFLTMGTDDHSEIYQYTTAPAKEILYQNINELELTRKSTSRNIRFSHIQTLVIHSSLRLNVIKETVDLGQIRNLIIYPTRKTFRMRSMLNEMPNLRQMTIAHDVKSFYRRIQYHPLEHIETLQIGVTLMPPSHYNAGHLSSIFPYVKHLHINHQCLGEEILDFLHRFKYVCTASFCCSTLYSYTVNEERRLIQSSLDDKQNANGLKYTYRFDGRKVYLWILPQSTHHPN